MTFARLTARNPSKTLMRKSKRHLRLKVLSRKAQLQDSENQPLVSPQTAPHSVSLHQLPPTLGDQLSDSQLHPLRLESLISGHLLWVQQLNLALPLVNQAWAGLDHRALDRQRRLVVPLESRLLLGHLRILVSLHLYLDSSSQLLDRHRHKEQVLVELLRRAVLSVSQLRPELVHSGNQRSVKQRQSRKHLSPSHSQSKMVCLAGKVLLKPQQIMPIALFQDSALQRQRNRLKGIIHLEQKTILLQQVERALAQPLAGLLL